MPQATPQVLPKPDNRTKASRKHGVAKIGHLNYGLTHYSERNPPPRSAVASEVGTVETHTLDTLDTIVVTILRITHKYSVISPTSCFTPHSGGATRPHSNIFSEQKLENNFCVENREKSSPFFCLDLFSSLIFYQTHSPNLLRTYGTQG